MISLNKTTDNPPERIGMKGLASASKYVMERDKVKPIEDLVSSVASEIIPNFDQEFIESIRRRVYDICNILSAVGMFVKIGNIIQYTGKINSNINKNGNLSEDDKRIRMKEQFLHENIKILTYYKIIIAENFNREKPEKIVKLPCIFFSADPNTQAIFPLNKSEITIIGKYKIYSPLNMLSLMHHDEDIVKQIVESSNFAYERTHIFTKAIST